MISTGFHRFFVRCFFWFSTLNLQLLTFIFFPSGSPSLFFRSFFPSGSPSGKLTKMTLFPMCGHRGFCQLFPFFPSLAPSETRNNILGKSILKLIFLKKKSHRTPQDARSQATPYDYTPHICPIIYIYFPYLKKKNKKR